MMGNRETVDCVVVATGGMERELLVPRSLRSMTPPAIVIRPATVADLPHLVALLRDDAIGKARPDDPGPPLPDVYLTALAEIDIDANNLLMVAESNAEVVGTFQLTFIRQLANRGGLVAQLEGVRVAAPLRGRRLGEAMVQWAIAEARRRGCFRLQLTSNKQRTDALRFYRRVGFVESHAGMKLAL